MWIFYLGTWVCGGGLVASALLRFVRPEWVGTELILIIGFLGVMSIIGVVGLGVEQIIDEKLHYGRAATKCLESISRFTDEARECVKSGKLAQPIVDSVNEVTQTVDALRAQLKAKNDSWE